jgi:hypothetical protein
MRQKLTSAEIAKRRREGCYHDGRQPLTAKKMAKLKGEGRYKDGLMPGLYLQVSKTGTKSWLLRYELNGSPERWMGLGPAVAFTLSEARQRARIARQQLADGVDPLKQKRAQRAAQAAAALKTRPICAPPSRKCPAFLGTRWRDPAHFRCVLRSTSAGAACAVSDPGREPRLVGG